MKKPMNPEQQAAFFEALERRRTQALVRQDLAQIEALHAPGYRLVTPGGRVFERADYLAAIARAPFYSGWEIESALECRPSPDMAALRYQALLSFPSGQQLRCWHFDLYERQADGRWLASWSQATEIRPSTSA